MNENEEFEFRLRLEKEQAIKSQPSTSAPSEGIDYLAPFKGFVVGGPVGFAAASGAEALKQAGHLIDKAAYKTGGTVTDIAAKTGMPPEAAAAVGFGANLGVQAIPMVIGGSAGKLAAPAIESKARQLMSSALKPPKAALESGQAGKAIDTMLDKGINVTPGGVEKLHAEIDVLNTAIKQKIADSTATVNKNEVAKRMDDLVERFKQQVTPQSDLQSIRSTLVDFLDHPLLRQISDMPVQLAQQLKTGTYRALGSKAYGELKGAEMEAQKTLARGLKEEIAKAVPGVGMLNKAESELLNAETLASARVLMDANKNPVGLGWITLNPAHWMGWMADRSPFVKSLLARGMHAGSQAIPATAGRLTGAAAGTTLGMPDTP